MKYDLSIILPSIRNEKLVGVYESILNSCTKHTFELIIVGPYVPPAELYNLHNVKFIKDLGSPMRCSNIAAELIEGYITTWFADDATYRPGTIDECLDILENQPCTTKDVLVTKYTESTKEDFSDEYFKLINAYPKSRYISPDWWIFNVAFMYTEYFQYLGGWDCRFESSPCGHADMAVRAQRDKCVIKFFSKSISDNEWEEGRSGTHFAIHDAGLEVDEPLYRQIYSVPECENRIRLDLSNWKNAPAIWRRFDGRYN